MCWYVIIALAVWFKNTEEVKERPLAWFISEALHLIISCPCLSLAFWQSNCMIALLSDIPANSPLRLHVTLENSPLAGYGKKTGFYFIAFFIFYFIFRGIEVL